MHEPYMSEKPLHFMQKICENSITEIFPKIEFFYDETNSFIIVLYIYFGREMLALGSAKTWPDALEIVTGQRKMEASALIEYFKPLQEWLEKKNKETGAKIGWDLEFGKIYSHFVSNAKTIIFDLFSDCQSKS